MKKKNKLSLGFISALLSVGLMTSCGVIDQGNSSQTDEIQQVYNAYVANGGTLSYEEWLATIKGEKGDKGDKGEDAITYIPCIFKNYNGTKLYEFYYEKGSTITYNGPEPTKPDEKDGEETVHWSFAGWDNSLENIQKPTIFTARFECLYTCTFVNYDGTELYSTQVNRGESATYVGDVPTKANTESTSGDTLEWTFTGWDKSLDNIKSDTTFTAQFYSPNAIQCTFLNYDGTVLTTQYCGNGDTVTYEGTTPSKPEVNNGDGTITKYDFTGWDKSLKNITGDTTFTAEFVEVTYYEVTFVNYDGTQLYKTSTFLGGQVEYVGDTPERPQDADGTTIIDYTFSKWDGSLANISAPTTLKAVYYSRTFTGYKVIFNDLEGSEIYSHYYESGTNATYLSYEPRFEYDNENVTMFTGWNESLKSISGPLTVSETYKTMTRGECGEYPQTKVSDETTIAELNKLTATDSQGYYTYNGERYAKKLSTGSGTFFDGTECKHGRTYWFKVEPIKWKYLEGTPDDLTVVSDVLLDAHRYNESYEGQKNGYYANNYKNSEIRSWLNSDFLDAAFKDDFCLKTTAVDNSVASTGESTNQYACETTNDKIYLLSVKDIINQDYGFANSRVTYDSARLAKVTDYAYMSGGSYDSLGNGYWWLRSPDYYKPYCARCVDNGGGANHDGGVDYANYCVRPALHFNFD